MVLFRGSKLKKRRRGQAIGRNPKIYMRTPRIKPRREVPFSKIIKFTLTVIVIGAIIYLIFFSGYFAIKKIIVLDNKNLTQKQVEDTISPIRYTNTVFNNLLFFRSNAATFALLNNYKELRSVQISKKLPSTLEIKVEESTPSLIWQTDDKKYLIDDTGSVISEADSNNQNLPIVNDLTKKNVEVKQKILTTSFTNFIKSISESFPQKAGVNIDSISVPETTYEIQVKTKEGVTVFLDTSRSADVQVNNLIKVLTEVKNKGISPNGIDYIDLRLPDKIFYKYK